MDEKAIEIYGNTNLIGSVIWLHGLGADGNDFAPVVKMLDLPMLRFILPHALYTGCKVWNRQQCRV